MPAPQLGQYKLLEKLGQGGMGVVWKARDPRLNRLVALKVLSPDTPINEERKRRFLQEARAASAFNHPNIVTIYEVGCDNGTDFIAMEYVAGKTLDRIIPRAGMPLAEVLRFAVPVADALSKAHAAGITHRDLKPGNIIVGDDGTPKLLDFGLAKLAETSPEMSAESATRTLHAKTEDGAILGTIAYMSPEQAEGKPVDGRSDIFSFGAVLYEMLAGRRAFPGDTQLSTLTAVMRDDPKPLRSMVDRLPPEMDRIIARCLRKDPAWRFQTAADLKVALAELKQESDTGGLAGPVTVRRPTRKALWVAAAMILAVAGLTAWRFLPRKQTQDVMRVVPLTTYDGPESHPSFSPDGSQFAFAWNGGQGTVLSIYVRMVEGGTPLRLAGGRTPEWSPDGKLIAYLEQQSLMLISPLGGTARTLVELARGENTFNGLAWAPDSESIAAVDNGNIVSISVKTGAKRILTQREGRKGDRMPAFSADGQSLAFAREFTTGAVDLEISSPPGGEPRVVASGHATIGGLGWAPDGKSLIYSATRGNTRGIFRIAATATPKDQPEMLPVPYGNDLSVSKPGKNGASRMAVELSGHDYNIWRLDLSTGQAAPLVSSTMVDCYPQYSPDGSKIAFATDRSGTMQIWVANSDGANQVQVTSFGSRAAAPRWSPDGRSIVFSGVRGPDRSIYVVGAQGGEPRRVVDGWRPSWSADGKSIYFTTRRSGSEQVWKAGVDGANPVQVTRSGGYEARDSLDGKWLLYIKSNDAPGLWRMPRQGGPEELLLPEVSTGNWNPIDGGLLYVERYERGIEGTVKRFWFESGQSKPFGKVDRVLSLGTSATRDGRYFLWSRMDRFDSDLVLVENFR